MTEAGFEARLQALEDRDAIRSLIASYGPLADTGDGEGIAALWSEDGSYSVGGMGKATGKVAISALMQGETHRAMMADGCAHLLGPVAIELYGEEATARGHSVVFRHVEGRFEVWRVAANRWELIRTGAGWRVRHRENAVLDGDEAARALLGVGP